VTISGPERPKVRIFRSEGRNVVNFVEKVTISRVGQAFPGGLRGPQSAFPSFSTGLATPKGRGFQNRPFFGSVWPDFSEKVTISGPGSPKVRFSGLRVEMSSISRPGGEKVTISGSGHRYFDLRGEISSVWRGSFRACYKESCVPQSDSESSGPSQIDLPGPRNVSLFDLGLVTFCLPTTLVPKRGSFGGSKRIERPCHSAEKPEASKKKDLFFTRPIRRPG